MMSQEEIPTDVAESIPKTVEITDLSGDNGGSVECVIDNIIYSISRICGGDDSKCTISVEEDGEVLVSSQKCPDWFYKTTAAESQLLNELLEDNLDEVDEIRINSGISTLSIVFSELMNSDDILIILRGFSEIVEDVEDILNAIVPEKRDGEADFRLRVDPDHPSVLSKKDPISYISSSAWATSNPNAFKTAFVEASAGGFEIDLPDDDPDLLIGKIKQYLNTDVDDQLLREERILNFLEDALHRRVTSGSGMSPRDEPDIGSEMFVEMCDNRDDPVIWIPQRVVFDELSDILSNDVLSEIPDIERYGIQRGIFAETASKIRPNGSPIRSYPVSSAKIERENDARAILNLDVLDEEGDEN